GLGDQVAHRLAEDLPGRATGQPPGDAAGRSQRADRRDEILLQQSRARTRRLDAAGSLAGGLRAVAGGSLLSRSEGRTRLGPLRVSRLAMHSSPSLCDDSERAVLCAGAANAIALEPGDQRRTPDAGTGPPRRRGVPRHARLAAPA